MPIWRSLIRCYRQAALLCAVTLPQHVRALRTNREVILNLLATSNLSKAEVGQQVLLEDVRAGLKLLRAAAVDDGDAEAAFALGRAWLEMDRLTLAASTDDANAMGAYATGHVDYNASTHEAAVRVVAEIRSARKHLRAERYRRPEFTGDTMKFATVDDYGTIPLRRDTTRAAYWLLRAASADHAGAQVALGNMYMAAEPRDVAQALEWYALAARVAHHSLPPRDGRVAHGADESSAACCGGECRSASIGEATRGAVVGDCGSVGSPSRVASDASDAPNPADGDDDLPKDSGSSAVDIVDASTPVDSKAHPDALFNLALIYYDGIEGYVPVDKRRAAAYMRAAAALRDESALFWLGHAHRVGDEEAGESNVQPRLIARQHPQ